MARGLPTLFSVFATAIRLAQSSGASEITVETLRVAFDHPLIFNQADNSSEGGFAPVSHEDMPLSKEAVAIIAPLGDIFNIPLDVLRRAIFADAL